MEQKANRREWGGKAASKQAGETSNNVDGAGADLTKTPRSPLLGVNLTVWTRSMLAALHRGLRGGKWFSLIDKVYSLKNLEVSFESVKANKGAAGSDHQTVSMFDKDRVTCLTALSQQVNNGSYRPRPVRRVMIPKPGSTQMRPLGIPAVRDRVVQAALRNVIGPIFEHGFAEHSYGFRPGRGCKDALRRVQQLLDEGYVWVVDADLKSYFDTINHDKLMEMVEEKITDGRILHLIRQFLQQGVLEEGRYWEPQEGTPQGGVISPLLSNIYLNPLDHLMAARGWQMVRYADDFVILCRSEQEAREALDEVRRWVLDHHLELHPDKTCIVNTSQPGGFTFLGYHFNMGHRLPGTKSRAKLQDTIRRKTRRCSGHSMEFIIGDLNRSLRGWFEYYKHCRPKWIFTGLDSWIRGRLRSILRKRMGLRGRARGEDQIRWKNSHFSQLGLFSLTAAWEAQRQSAKR